MIMERSYDEILYVDESTFHLWQKVNRCWVRKGMKLALSKIRGPSLTVIGAISEERGLVHFEIFDESNNSDLFSNFIIALKKKCEGRRVVVILDNLSIHATKKLEEVYDPDFKEMFLPTYSCELNPIETLWSVIKRKWTRNLHPLGEELMMKRNTEKKEKILKITIEKLRETIKSVENSTVK